MADEQGQVPGQSNAGSVQKAAVDPAEEWRRAVANRREYAIRNAKAMAAGIAVGILITAVIMVGVFSNIEGGWDGSQPRNMGRLLGLLSLPGILVGIWVRSKLKVPNSQ
jgi:hypothetical protein